MMHHATFLVPWAGAPLLAGWILSRAGIRLTRFSPISLLFAMYLLLAHTGLLLLYYRLDEYSLSIGVDDPSIVLQLCFYSATALLLMATGAWYAMALVRGSEAVASWQPAEPATSRERWIVFGVALLCVFVFLEYLQQVPSIALLPALQGDLQTAAIARSDMGNAFGGKYWRYHLFFRIVLDFCVIFYFAHYLARKRVSSFLMAFIVFGVAMFTALVATEKAPLAMLLFMVYLCYVQHRGGWYWQRSSKYVLILGAIAVAGLYVIVMGAPDLMAGLRFLFGRVTVGQISPAYFYVELFPREHPYLWGRSLPNPGGLLPFESFPLTTYVLEFSVRRMATDVVGSAPTVFWGEMFANFGPAGVAVSAFLVGVGLSLLSIAIARLPASPATTAATVTLSVHYATLTMTGLSTFLFDTTMAALAGFTVVLLLARRGGTAP